MAEASEMEHRLMILLAERVHHTFASDCGPDGVGGLERIADAMVAALPGNHPYDQTIGPFYDTAGLTRWWGVSRQSLHKKIAAGSLIACPLDDGQLSYPVWQFTTSATVHPSMTAVWRALRVAADPWTCALWMSAPSEDLDGATAVEWLAQGREVATVLRAAEADAQRWVA